MRKRKSSRGCGILLVLFLLLLLGVSGEVLNDSFSEYPLPAETVFVETTGGVKNPGVHGFSNPPALSELLKAAGGLTCPEPPDISQKQVVFMTGEKVAITCKQQQVGIAVDRMSPFYRLTLGIPISINIDTAVGLTAVPGIGPKTAEAIVSARGKRGGFKALEDLIFVRGIGDALFAKISPYLTL